jgi:FAD-linked oxidoreductase
MKNWSGNVRWEPNKIFHPSGEEEIAEIVKVARQQGRKVRIMGSGHSFTSLCKTDDFLITLDHFQGIIHIDKDKKLARVKAGTKLKTLNLLLDQQGLGLENLGDIDEQSIAGAISTGTHGTGASFGNLCTQLRALRFINGLGQVVSCSEQENPQLFKAAVLSLGALGIITEVTLQCVPAYNLALHIRKKGLEAVLANYKGYNAANRHFEFYWFPHTPYVLTKELNQSNKTDKDTFGDYLQEVVLENYALKALCELSYRLPSLSRAISRLAAITVSDYHKSKRSYKVFSTYRIVRFNEMEYNVPVEAYPEVMKEVTQWINRHHHHVMFPVENRFVKGDDIFLSPAYQRDSAYIAIHAYHKKNYHAYFGAVEDIFKAYGGRPHWGKIHTLKKAELEKLYPEFDAFRHIRAAQDPHDVFLNPYLQTIFS